MPRFSMLILVLPLLLAACARAEATTAAKPPTAASSVEIKPLAENQLRFTALAGRIVCEDLARVEAGSPNTCTCPAGGTDYLISSKDDMTFVSCRQLPKSVASHILSTKPSH